jgi:tripartite-type tricarboxylate transporter receptor subunit TctC
MMLSRRSFLLSASAAVSVGANHRAEAQATWPSRPIRFVVPLPPGGSYDYLARALAEPVSQSLKQPFVVENRVGADGRLGTEFLARQVADGYAIGIISSTNMAHTALFKDMPFDIINDFSPISIICTGPFALVVSPSMPVNDIRGFMALVKSRPGYVTFASSGNGSPWHLIGEMVKSRAKVDMVHVPYKGTTQIRQALLGGEVMCAFAPIGPFLAMIKEGKVRALAVCSDSPSELLPDLKPLSVELGIPNLALNPWLGLVTVKGTSTEIVNGLSREFAQVVKTPEFSREKLLHQGYEPVGSTPEAMAQIMRDDVAMFAQIVRDAHIVAE